MEAKDKKNLRIGIVSRTAEDAQELRDDLLRIKNEWSFDNIAPEIVVSYGGDGTFLVAERMYPGIPKLILRKNSVCKKCVDGEPKVILNKLVERDFAIVSHPKLETSLNGKIFEIKAVNDVVIRNSIQNQALRFDIENGREKLKGIIGDGVVVSTPFGSSGYFHSITRENFEKGMGVAFNNSTIHIKPLIVEKGEIKVIISRESALLSIDNDQVFHKVQMGDEIVVRESEEKFKLVHVAF